MFLNLVAYPETIKKVRIKYRNILHMYIQCGVQQNMEKSRVIKITGDCKHQILVEYK